MTTTITPLAMLNDDGHLVYTTYATALLHGVHPDDLTNDLLPEDATNEQIIGSIPTKWAQQTHRRFTEARAHGTPADLIAIVTYWAKTDHNAETHTDPLGQTWINKPPTELWPPATGHADENQVLTEC